MLPTDVTVVVVTGRARDITPNITSASWASAAIGGFADATFQLEGWWSKTQIPHLSTIRVLYGDALLWEGRVEDITYDVSDGVTQTTLTCFGFQRLLQGTSVQFAGIKSDIDWQEIPGGKGSTFGKVLSTNTLLLNPTAFTVSVGRFDPTDPTKVGIQIAGNGVASAALDAEGAEIYLPNGCVVARIWYAVTQSGPHAANLIPILSASSSGDMTTSDGTILTTPTTGKVQDAGSLDRIRLRLGLYDNAGVTPTAADLCQFTNIRLLGTGNTAALRNFVNLDDTGATTFGYYGGTLLTEILALVPGLAVGQIESGSDYIIQALTANVRRAALDVIKEIASYYTREWGVWDNATFAWQTNNLDEPQWLATLADLSSLNLRSTVDNLVKTEYVLFTDAGGLPGQQSSVSADQRNPFVKRGVTSDELTDPGFPMVNNTASQLASRLAASRGSFPVVAGTITLPALTVVKHGPSGSPAPAYTIRAGQNLLISDLPKTDLFQAGRDGETLFHIVSAVANMAENTVALTVEGHAPTMDVTLARLAAVTRLFTG